MKNYSQQLLREDASKSNSNNRPGRSSSFHKAIAKAVVRGLQELTRLRHGSSSSSSSSYISLHGNDHHCYSSAVPKGYLAVHVGDEHEHRRFIVRTQHLHHPIFKVLLKRCEEEFGFYHEGPIFIPCQIDLFHLLLWHIENNDDMVLNPSQAQELIDLYLVSLADFENS